MENQTYLLLLVSMFLNFIVIVSTFNKPKAAIPVSLSGISMVIQGLIMRMVAVQLN